MPRSYHQQYLAKNPLRLLRAWGNGRGLPDRDRRCCGRLMTSRQNLFTPYFVIDLLWVSFLAWGP